MLHVKLPLVTLTAVNVPGSARVILVAGNLFLARESDEITRSGN